MITQGLLYTVIGMGMTFTFLIVMIFVMILLGKFVAALDARWPELKEAPVKTQDNTGVAIAIAVAKRG